MSNSRRYEILLPLKFNDGQSVPWTLIGETLQELKHRFEGVSWDTQIIRGIWQHGRREYRDDLIRIFVDVDDRAEHRDFFQAYKERLKSKFHQVDIWMITFPIEVI